MGLHVWHGLHVFGSAHHCKESIFIDYFSSEVLDCHATPRTDEVSQRSICRGSIIQAPHAPAPAWRSFTKLHSPNLPHHNTVNKFELSHTSRIHFTALCNTL